MLCRCLLLALAFAVSACSDRPSAPALSNEAVYDNSHFGLRFEAPEGWNQTARSDRPELGDKDRLLIRFQTPPGAKPALFEVTVRDGSGSADESALVRAASHSQGAWEPVGPPESVTVGNADGKRYRLLRTETEKETIAVRRGARLFFFTLVAPISESKPHEQFRQVIQTVRWSK